MHHCLVAVWCEWQGFGKRKSAVGIPRPKKSKVLSKEGSGLESVVADTSEIDQGEEDSASTSPVEVAHSDTPSESDDEDLQKEAAAVTKMARAAVREAAVEVRKAEAALRHERRLDEERERRWWAAERRKEAPPAHLQLERAYKSQVRDLKARLALSEARRRAAEAQAELAGCQLIEKDVRLARLR